MSKYMPKFLDESGRNLMELRRSLEDIARGHGSPLHNEQAFRMAHSIKGTAAMFGFDRLAAIALELEDVLSKLMHDKIAQTQRVSDAADVATDAMGILLQGIADNHEVDVAVDKLALQKLASCAA